MGEAFIRRRKGCLCNTIGHGNITWFIVSEPTCTEEGHEFGRCDRCGEDVDVNFPEALGHLFQYYQDDVPATCTQDGYRTWECGRCAELIEENIPALGHSWVYPQCDHPYCETCGEINYEIDGHNWVLIGGEYGTDDYKGYECTNCGAATA